jgi:hypothetical protein
VIQKPVRVKIKKGGVMKIVIVVEKKVSKRGKKYIDISVSCDKYISDIFQDDKGFILDNDENLIRNVENGSFVDDGYFRNNVSVFVSSDEEIKGIIDRIVDVYRRVDEGKKDWKGSFERVIEID